MSIFDYKDNFKAIEQIPCELVWESPNKPENPGVSIVMPIYKNRKYFKNALESALNQDWSGSYEVVVVDNCPDENNPNQRIVEEVNDARVRYFRNAENLGIVGNWNRCVLKARASMLTFLHDDDMFVPSTLSTAIAVAEKHPGKLVISSLKLINGDNNSFFRDEDYEIPNKFHFLKPRDVAKVSLFRALGIGLGNCVGTIFNRENLIELGGFHQEAYMVLDYEMLVRYCHRYGAVYIQKPNALYRIADNVSYSVYATIAPKFKEVATDMTKKIHLPKWILNRVVDTRYKQIDEVWHKSFAPPEKQVSHNISKFDRILTQTYIRLFNLLEVYRISFYK